MTRSRAQDARSLPRVVVYWRDATTTIRFAVEVNVATVKDNPLLASDLLPIDGQFGEIKFEQNARDLRIGLSIWASLD